MFFVFGCCYVHNKQELNDFLNGYFGLQYLQGSWNLLGQFWNTQNQEIHQDGYYSSSSWSSSSQMEQEPLLTTSANTENESKTNTNGNNNTNDNTNTNANDESKNKNLQKYKTHTMKQEITGDYFFKHRKTPQGNK